MNSYLIEKGLIKAWWKLKSNIQTKCRDLKIVLKRICLSSPFIGRSNVGKSSLINMLCNNGKSLPKLRLLPGKTQLINHFLINDNWFLVDLPGYGYAKTGKSKRRYLRPWFGIIAASAKLRHALCVDWQPASLQKLMRNLWNGVVKITHLLASSSPSRIKFQNELAKTFGTLNRNFLKWEDLQIFSSPRPKKNRQGGVTRFYWLWL